MGRKFMGRKVMGRKFMGRMSMGGKLAPSDGIISYNAYYLVMGAEASWFIFVRADIRSPLYQRPNEISGFLTQTGS